MNARRSIDGWLNFCDVDEWERDGCKKMDGWMDALMKIEGRIFENV